MSSIYDDPELSQAVIQFTNVGDRVRGTMIRAESTSTQYGKVAKYWLFDLESETERTMLAGATDLWRQLSKLRPEPGDIIEVELTHAPERGMKLYRVEVEPGDNSPF